jgi:hypothetical protein
VFEILNNVFGNSEIDPCVSCCCIHSVAGLYIIERVFVNKSCREIKHFNRQKLVSTKNICYLFQETRAF